MQETDIKDSEPQSEAAGEALEQFADEIEDEMEKGEMPFLDHVEELRWTLLKIICSLVLGCIVAAVFITRLFDVLDWPLRQALGDRADETLALRSFFAIFSTIFQVLFLGGFALALPAALYFLAQFIAPGLTSKEKRMLGPGCIAGALLFLIGGSFAFFILVPSAIGVAAQLSDKFGFVMLWSPETYYGLLVWMVIGVGLSFELPLLLVLLVYLQIISHAKLVAFRPYSIVLFLTLSAIVTPTPDPFTFLFLAIPMYLLYEVSLVFAKMVEGTRKASA